MVVMEEDGIHDTLGTVDDLDTQVIHATPGTQDEDDTDVHIEDTRGFTNGIR